METNNNDLKKVKSICTIQLLITFLMFYCFMKKFTFYIYILYIILIFSILYFSYFSYIAIKKPYIDIRKIITYIDANKKGLIKDGDIGILYDRITDMKKRTNAYEELIKQEKENLRKIIDDICHQLKTPLSSISINNEILLEKYHDIRLERNQQQIEKINHLLQSLLTISKLENNAVHFNFQKLPMKYIIDLTLENIYSLTKDKNIICKDINGEIYCDEGWIVEGLSNIIKNSLEQESVKYITINSNSNEQYVKLIIKDDGTGFDDKDIKNIFKRFYKGKNSHKESTGIGLALTKEIIRNHHGYIEIYNAEGACFEITFPKLNVNEKKK